ACSAMLANSRSSRSRSGRKVTTLTSTASTERLLDEEALDERGHLHKCVAHVGELAVVVAELVDRRLQLGDVGLELGVPRALRGEVVDEPHELPAEQRAIDVGGDERRERVGAAARGARLRVARIQTGECVLHRGERGNALGIVDGERRFYLRD